MFALPPTIFFFFFNDTATTEIYTLSLHDALPICLPRGRVREPVPAPSALPPRGIQDRAARETPLRTRSEEHTSELQSPDHLVCRLLLEKKKKRKHQTQRTTRTSATYPDSPLSVQP